MGDTTAWTIAVLLVGAGVATEAYLAWNFIRDWREGRAEERARRARWRAESTAPEQSSRSVQFSGGTALAALGMTAAVAAAQTPAAPPASEAQGTPPNVRSVEDSPEPVTTATTPTAETSSPAAPASAPTTGAAPVETVGTEVIGTVGLQWNL